MSSSGPYQSKLLNLLVRQTRRLRDESGRRWRQFRTTAVWGTQILLYPIYVLFQSGRMIERQFKQTIRKVFPQLKAAERSKPRGTHSDQAIASLPADTAIRTALQTIQSFALAVPIEISGGAIALPLQLAAAPSESGLAVANSSALVETGPSEPPDPVRGIATWLDTRSLVLVTTQNEILDILTIEQQALLQRRMIGELAGYLRQQRLLQTTQQQPLPFLLPPISRPTQLLPVRLFRQLMGWMQLGPVAITANLFQEASLALYMLQWEEAIQQDGAIAASSPFRPAIPRQLPESTSSTPLFMPAKPRSPTKRPIKALKPAQPNFWVNLFGKPRTASSQPLPPGSTTDIQPSFSGRLTPIEEAGVMAMTFTDPSPGPLERVRSPELQPVNSGQASPDLQPAFHMQTQPDLPSRSGMQVRSPDASLTTEGDPSTIETQATLVEYVKHPLEQLLEWLDRGMLWIETRIAQFITWLRHL